MSQGLMSQVPANRVPQEMPTQDSGLLALVWPSTAVVSCCNVSKLTLKCLSLSLSLSYVQINK